MARKRVRLVLMRAFHGGFGIVDEESGSDRSEDSHPVAVEAADGHDCDVEDVSLGMCLVFWRRKRVVERRRCH